MTDGGTGFRSVGRSGVQEQGTVLVLLAALGEIASLPSGRVRFGGIGEASNAPRGRIGAGHGQGPTRYPRRASPRSGPHHAVAGGDAPAGIYPLPPPDVLRSYQRDRFVTPGAMPFDRLRRAEGALLASLPPDFEILVLAPLVPLGTHSASGRSTRTASSPRSGGRRSRPTRRTAWPSRRPSAVAPCLRPTPDRQSGSAWQHSSGSFGRSGSRRRRRWQHFHLFGLATAGRDVDDLTFERESAAEHVRFAAVALLRAGLSRVRVELTDFTGGEATAICDAVRHGLDDVREAEVVDRHDRLEARGYYAPFCFKVRAVIRGSTFEIAGGGLVDWTQRLVPSQKERLFISGLGVERLALATDPDFQPAADEA